MNRKNNQHNKGEDSKKRERKEEKRSKKQSTAQKSQKGKEKKDLMVKLAEKQVGRKTHNMEKKKLKNKGTLTIKNETGSAIYDLTLRLKNHSMIDLSEKLQIRYLEDSQAKEIEYTITEDKFFGDLSEHFEFRKDFTNPIAIYNQTTPLSLKYLFKNHTHGPLNVNISKALPEQIDITQLPTLEDGEISKNAKLKWSFPTITPNTSRETAIEAEIRTKNKQKFRSGKIKYKINGEDFTFSKVTIDTLKINGFEKIYEMTQRKERMDERGIWNVNIHVKNKSKTTIHAIGKIDIVEGEIPQNREKLGEIPGKVKDVVSEDETRSRIISDETVITAGEKKVIGPFPIQNTEEPKLIVDVDYSLPVGITKKASGVYEIKDLSIPCLSVKVNHDAVVDHPSTVYGLTEHELMSNKEEPVEVRTKLKNTGSANLDKLVLTWEIPENFTPPEKSKVRAVLKTQEKENGIKLTNKEMQVKISPEDPSSENEVTLIIQNIEEKFDTPFQKDDFLGVKFVTTALSPNPQKKYTLPCTATVFVTSKDPGVNFTPTGKQPPTFETIKTRREIWRGKKVTSRKGEKEFIVKAILRNEGNLPVKKYMFKDLIPSNFELVKKSVKPSPSETHDVPHGKELIWKFDKLVPRQKKTIEYVVKGTGDFKVAELKKVRN